MKTLCQFVFLMMCVAITASGHAGEAPPPAKVAWDQVPSSVMDTANRTERHVEWKHAVRFPGGAASGAASFVLQGRIVVREQRERIGSDGDIEITPGVYEQLEVCVLEDGTLEYIVKSLDLAAVPAEILQALKKKTVLEPYMAYVVRNNPKDKPNGYLFWIDSKGLLKYAVSSDGKRVERITTP